MPNQVGRPRFVPTDDQRTTVEAMAGYGIPHEDICRVVISPQTKEPIDAKTLRLAFRSELDTGHVKANSGVAQSLHKQALAGNVTAAIWWSKARMGWKETVTQNQQMLDADGKPVAPIGPTINWYGYPGPDAAPKAVGGKRKQSD